MEDRLLLAIEQGNTNTLFAIHDGSEWVAQWRVATESTRTADEYAAWLYQLMSMRGLDFAAIDDCIISSVVPQSLFDLHKLAQRYFGKPARQVKVAEAPPGRLPWLAPRPRR